MRFRRKTKRTISPVGLPCYQQEEVGEELGVEVVASQGSCEMPGCIYTFAMKVSQQQHITATFPSTSSSSSSPPLPNHWLPALFHPSLLFASSPGSCCLSHVIITSSSSSTSSSKHVFPSPVPLLLAHFLPSLHILLPRFSTGLPSDHLSLLLPRSPLPSCLLLSSSLCLTGREIALIPTFN